MVGPDREINLERVDGGREMWESRDAVGILQEVPRGGRVEDVGAAWSMSRIHYRRRTAGLEGVYETGKPLHKLPNKPWRDAGEVLHGTSIFVYG